MKVENIRHIVLEEDVDLRLNGIYEATGGRL